MKEHFPLDLKLIQKFHELYQKKYTNEADNQSVGYWSSFKEKINGFREMIEGFKKSKSKAKEEADYHKKNLEHRENLVTKPEKIDEYVKKVTTEFEKTNEICDEIIPKLKEMESEIAEKIKSLAPEEQK